MTKMELFNIILSEDPGSKVDDNREEIFKLLLDTNYNPQMFLNNHYRKILEVLDKVPCNLTLRLAALFHNIGKIWILLSENDESELFHWELSQQLFANFAKRVGLDSGIRNVILNILYFYDLDFDALTINEINGMQNGFTRDEIEKIFILKEAIAKKEHLEKIAKEKEFTLERIKIN